MLVFGPCQRGGARSLERFVSACGESSMAFYGDELRFGGSLSSSGLRSRFTTLGCQTSGDDDNQPHVREPFSVCVWAPSALTRTLQVIDDGVEH